jgi:hypothetical protein
MTERLSKEQIDHFAELSREYLTDHDRAFLQALDDLAAAEAKLAAVRALAAEQADDSGLWFAAETAPENIIEFKVVA